MPSRPLCQCACGCRRRPGRRIICAMCGKAVGPGCCFVRTCCHVCGPPPVIAGPGGSFNEYGSEGPTSLNEPPELAFLLEGTVVFLNLMSGEPLEESVHGLTGTFQVDCRITPSLLAESFAITVSRHLRIPPSCVTFVWGNTHVNWDTEEMSVWVSMQLISMDPDRPDDLLLTDLRTSGDDDICCICQWPCEDADNDVWLDVMDARARNCAVCEPCFLCQGCSLRLRDGSSRCLDCISQEELTLIDSAQVQIWCGRDADLVRRRVLNPEICW